MSSIVAALFALTLISGGAVAGLLLRALLPDHHLNDDARDVIKLGAGLIATLAALVLGLLISSAKSSLDTMNAELTQTSAKVIVLDRVLANYGPETKEVRDLLQRDVHALRFFAIDAQFSQDRAHLARPVEAGIQQTLKEDELSLRRPPRPVPMSIVVV